jgi:hypothetical protein
MLLLVVLQLNVVSTQQESTGDDIVTETNATTVSPQLSSTSGSDIVLPSLVSLSMVLVASILRRLVA